MKKAKSFFDNVVSHPQAHVNNAFGASQQQTLFVLVMVGLPARGKSYIARLLCKYLNWLNVPTRIFNAGEYRRHLLGPGQKAEFWDVNNSEGFNQRREISVLAVNDMINWLTGGTVRNYRQMMNEEEEEEEDGVEMDGLNHGKRDQGMGADDDHGFVYSDQETMSDKFAQRCAIFDATNTTRERRKYLIESLRDGKAQVPLNRIIFIESRCDNETVINANIREIKIKSSDYQNVDNKEEAVSDFVNRIRQYEKVYEPLDDRDALDKTLSFITMIDVGRKFIMNRIGGYIPGRITSFLMNMHIGQKVIWLSRHGESRDNVVNKLGGDSTLSERGECYSQVLFEFVTQKMEEDLLLSEQGNESEDYYSLKGLSVWTSTLRRTCQTAAPLKSICSVMQWKALDEIDAGVCEGMTYEEVKKQMPVEHYAREQDKFRYRYPRGESYLDMVFRIEPVIMELERQRNPVLIVGHQAVNRVMHAYLAGQKPEECTNIPIPLHTVIQIIPNAYGYTEKRFDLNDRVEGELQRRREKRGSVSFTE